MDSENAFQSVHCASFAFRAACLRTCDQSQEPVLEPECLQYQNLAIICRYLSIEIRMGTIVRISRNVQNFPTGFDSLLHLYVISLQLESQNLGCCVCVWQMRKVLGWRKSQVQWLLTAHSHSASACCDMIANFSGWVVSITEVAKVERLSRFQAMRHKCFSSLPLL